MIVDELFTRRHSVYIPVYAGGCATFIHKYGKDYDLMRSRLKNFQTSSFKIWDKDDKDKFFYYPYGLFSACQFKSKKLLRDYFMDKEKMVLFADSGGFQISKNRAVAKTWTREKALEWAEENANITAILDTPVSTPGVTFEEAANNSLQNAQWIAENRRTTNPIKILNVISGTSLNVIKKWYESGIGDIHLDGWAHGGKISLLSEYILPVLFLLHKGVYSPNMERPLIHHFFGVSRPVTFVYIAWLQKCFNNMNIPVQFTFDSSTASKYSLASSIIVNFSLTGNWTVQFSKNDMQIKDGLMKLRDAGLTIPCDCPVCASIENVYDIVDPVNYVDYYLFEWMHNFYMILRHKRMVDFVIDTESDSVYRGSFGAKVYDAMKLTKKLLQHPESVVSGLTCPVWKELDTIVREYEGSKKNELVIQGTSLNSFFGE